jgi:DinB family protein
MLALTEVLLANLDFAYDRKAWHGPTLRGSLRGLTVEQLLWRPSAKRHNIWELVAHCAYWKFAVRRRLTGERSESFPLKGSNFFVSPADGDEKTWREVMRILNDQHKQLRATIESLPRRALDRKGLRMILGVAAHDVYHAGQVQLLKRLQS